MLTFNLSSLLLVWSTDMELALFMLERKRNQNHDREKRGEKTARGPDMVVNSWWCMHLKQKPIVLDPF